MARLSGPADQVLKLDVADYELDLSCCDNDYDANWLMIRVTVVDGNRRWTGTDPDFLTWAMRRLAQWLRAVAGSTPVALKGFTGMDGMLQFEVSGHGESVRIRVYLLDTFAPPHDAPEGGARRRRSRRHSMRFEPGTAAILRFADEVDQLHSAFPIRVVEVNGPARHFVTSADQWRRVLYEGSATPPPA